MKRNVAFAQHSTALKDGARALADRTVEKVRSLIDERATTHTQRGGRKAHKMEQEIRG